MTAVDLGSFSKASEVVGYTQSGLTHLVDSLEREIGLRLVRRDRSGVSLTREGEALMPSIREFLRENAKLENQIAAITEKKSETIRVAAYASIAMHWMPEILYRFRRVCPDIDVDLRMVDHELEPFELLEKWETDVIFAARQPGFACDWTPLWNDPMCAILPQDYPLTGDEFPIEEFTDKEFLMPYGRFDLDARAVFAQNGVEPRIPPVLCRRRDGHPHGGQGAGPFDDGGNDDPRTAGRRARAAHPSRSGPRAWDGAASARGAVRGDRPAAQLRAGIHRGRGEGARKEIEMEKRR